MPGITPPFYPIIYVRGYAMRQDEIDATVSTPYMGFNLGATKVRQDWNGKVIRHIFESPLVRLMKDFGYQDIYKEGQEKKDAIPAKSIVIYRYYEQGDSDLGTGKAPKIPEAAQGLDELILEIRKQVCGNDQEALAKFKVYLVAHSMGGLVCRCFLQNPQVGTQESKALVDKVFTYATPHNGIEMAGFNVPDFLGLWDMNNFNRKKMTKYLDLPPDSKRVDSLNGKFEPNRFFCLVGTNHKDYSLASRKLAGEMSDGLVKIDNAAVKAAPRAFVYRSHSGPYGIVNSEEGYQNLTRFLFGNVRVDGILEIDNLPLPPHVIKEQKKGKKIRASYYFETTVSPRGSMTYKLTERRKETFSAILRKYDDLFRTDNVPGLSRPRSPVLFSVFLNKKNITVGRSLVFSIELSVSTTGYEIDGFLFFDRDLPGEYLFRNTLMVRATPAADGWKVRYSLTDDAWSERRGLSAQEDSKGLFIPVTSKKGFKGKLRLVPSSWK
jgi:PGAP1-like protein